MKTRSILTGLMMTAVLGAPVTSPAAPAPQQTIQQGVEQVRSILRQNIKKGSAEERRQKEKLKKIVDEFLDYQELSRRSLGPHWKERTPKEQVEFTSLLRDLIEEAYTQPISDNIDFSMSYEDEEIAGDESTASVMAIASAKDKKGKTVSEDLTFHLFAKNRKWMIFDVEFGDVSLVRHYRGEFNRKIKKESYPALVEAMKKKLEEIRSGKTKAEKRPQI